MNYKFIRDGVEELVTKETWHWLALYNDGTSLQQFDDNGYFHQFSEIDQSKLSAFKMMSDDKIVDYVIPFDQTMKLVHFYKITRLNVYTPSFKEVKSYCFGYEKKVKGRNEKHFLVITPNEVILCEDPNIINFK